MKPVYINQISSFMPNHAIGNADMEDYLGSVDGRRSRSRAIVLRNNGIKTRHYALDKDGRVTHTNAQMCAAAVRGLADHRFDLGDISVLACGTTSPDQLLPSHAAMVHGELGHAPMEVVSFTGACCAGMGALRYAMMSVQTGHAEQAVCTASERLSSQLRGQNYQQEAREPDELERRPMLAFEKDFLRWMLSDGAAATRLSGRANESGPSLRLDWLDLRSYAHELASCMVAGAEKQDDGSVRGWAEYSPAERLQRSIFSLKQDVRLLDETITRIGCKDFAEALQRHGVHAADIDYLLPHVSSCYFVKKVDDGLRANNMIIPMDKWFFNLTRLGNVGSASIFLALEELLHSGRLEQGQKIVLSVPESARFTYATALLTVC